MRTADAARSVERARDDTSGRTAGLIAWTLWVLAATATTAGTMLGLGAGSRGATVADFSPLSWIGGAALTLAYATVGLFLRRRVPGNAVGWLFLVIGATSGLGNAAFGYLVGVPAGVAAPSVDPGTVAWLTNLVPPTWVLAGIVLVVVFPHGRRPTGRWTWLVPAAAVGSLLLAAVLALASGPVFLVPAFANPYGVTGVLGDAVRLVVPVAMALMIGFVFAAAANMLARYKIAESVERQQLKWFAFGAAVWAVGVTVYALRAVADVAPRSALAELVWLVFVITAAFLPIAAGLAILRYGLYQIDTIIGRTVIYGALTAILAGLYSASIKLVQSIFVAITGNESDAAVVITTLLLATSFTPIKGWLERRVARRYKEPEREATTPIVAADAELTRRIEEISRRVATEVLEARERAVSGSTTSAGPDRSSSSRQPDP